MQHDTSHPTRRSRRWIAIPLLTVATALFLLTPTLAQENGEAPAQPSASGEERRAHGLERWLTLPSRLPDGPRAATAGTGPHGGFAGMPGRLRIEAVGPFGGLRAGGWSADGRSSVDAFVRWLESEPRQRSVLPGLVGQLDDGASLRLSFYDADPAEGGAPRVELSYLAGQDDLEAFQTAVRAAAAEASHVVVDLIGRTIALPQVGEAEPEEQVDGD